MFIGFVPPSPAGPTSRVALLERPQPAAANILGETPLAQPLVRIHLKFNGWWRFNGDNGRRRGTGSPAFPMSRPGSGTGAPTVGEGFGRRGSGS